MPSSKTQKTLFYKVTPSRWPCLPPVPNDLATILFSFFISRHLNSASGLLLLLSSSHTQRESNFYFFILRVVCCVGGVDSSATRIYTDAADSPSCNDRVVVAGWGPAGGVHSTSSVRIRCSRPRPPRDVTPRAGRDDALEAAIDSLLSLFAPAKTSKRLLVLCYGCFCCCCCWAGVKFGFGGWWAKMV